MRRKTGFVLGACASLVLVSAAGAAALSYAGDEGRQVGTWHDAPNLSRTPVAAQATLPGATGPRVSAAAPTGRAGAPRPDAVASGPAGGDRVAESATAGDGRQRVGE